MLKEINFETTIEQDLIKNRGYVKGDRNDYDPELAVFPKAILQFIQTTQPKLWTRIQDLNKDKVSTVLLSSLTKERCLVHFAVDTDQVYMATKLSGNDTFFLPFNQGHNHGAGNPPNDDNVRTAYLWQEILTKASLLDILARFLHIDE